MAGIAERRDLQLISKQQAKHNEASEINLFRFAA